MLASLVLNCRSLGSSHSLNTDEPTERKSHRSEDNSPLVWRSSVQRIWPKEEETTLVLCMSVPTCMCVVGRGLWSLCAATLLEEEGGSFDHKEALTEAGKSRSGKYIQESFEISTIASEELPFFTVHFHTRLIVFYHSSLCFILTL